MFYRILIQDLYNKDRYISSSIYKSQEIKNNEPSALLQKEYLLRHPDDYLLDAENLNEIVQQLSIIGYQKIDVVANI